MSSKDGGNFYNDFGDFDDDEDEDDDDDDEYENLDVSSFRSNLESIMGEDTSSSSSSSSSSFNVDDLISFATESSTTPAVNTDWAKSLLTSNDSDKSPNVSSILVPGSILIANPDRFCSEQCSPALLSKFGLTLPPPADLNPDRRADLLPVLILLDRHPLRGSHALLLNRRTGYLIGDLEQQKDQDNAAAPRLGAFMIQPLWFGGTSSGNAPDGLDMLHLCPVVENCKKLTDDGLYYGGDPNQAQEAMGNYTTEDNKVMTGFDFKFFVQSTRWLPSQLEKEVKDGTWYVASVSKDVLFKSRDRLGTKRAKPLWTEIMELMGGEFSSVRDNFYGE